MNDQAFPNTDNLRTVEEVDRHIKEANAQAAVQVPLTDLAPESFREHVEAVIACLGDDAQSLRAENDEDERAYNMEAAAELLTRYLAAAPEAPAQVPHWSHSCNALCVDGLNLWIDTCPHCGMPRAAASEAPAQANNLTAELQQRCSDWGVYWRAPDAHGVILTVDQATELLRDALGVEVEVKTPAQAASPHGCTRL